MSTETKCVLGVEHECVELELDGDVHETQQRLECRDLAARNVEHDAPHGEVGFVLDFADGQGADTRSFSLSLSRPQKLDCGFDRIAEPRGSTPPQLDRIRSNLDSVAIARLARGLTPVPECDLRAQIRAAQVRFDRQPDPASALDGVAQNRGARPTTFIGAGGKDDWDVAFEGEESRALDELLWLGQQRGQRLRTGVPGQAFAGLAGRAGFSRTGTSSCHGPSLQCEVQNWSRGGHSQVLEVRSAGGRQSKRARIDS